MLLLLLLLLRNEVHVNARPSVPRPQHGGVRSGRRRRWWLRRGGRDGHRLRDRNGYCCCGWRRRVMCRGGNRRRNHLWNRGANWSMSIDGGGGGGVEPASSPGTPGLTSPARARPGVSSAVLMLLNVVLAVLVKGGGSRRDRRRIDHCGGHGDGWNGWRRHAQQDMRGGK